MRALLSFRAFVVSAVMAVTCVSGVTGSVPKFVSNRAPYWNGYIAKFDAVWSVVRPVTSLRSNNELGFMEFFPKGCSQALATDITSNIRLWSDKEFLRASFASGGGKAWVWAITCEVARRPNFQTVWDFMSAVDPFTRKQNQEFVFVGGRDESPAVWLFHVANVPEVDKGRLVFAGILDGFISKIGESISLITCINGGEECKKQNPERSDRDYTVPIWLTGVALECCGIWLGVWRGAGYGCFFCFIFGFILIWAGFTIGWFAPTLARHLATP